MEKEDYHDIFLSHAWMDGEEFDSGDKTKWILSFMDKLVHELDRPGVWPLKVETFLDMKSIQSGSVPKHINDAISKSLVFVCLVSRNYWRRPYCAEEFDIFKLNLGNRPMFSDGSDLRRVIPVVLTPLNN